MSEELKKKKVNHRRLQGTTNFYPTYVDGNKDKVTPVGAARRTDFQTVLPRYINNTLILMAGVAAVTLGFGLSSAWTVVRCDFPGRRIFEWILLLPARHFSTSAGHFICTFSRNRRV